MRCGFANDIYVAFDNGHFCDRYREIRYVLTFRPNLPDGWDMRDAPPDYWNCEVRPGDGG